MNVMCLGMEAEEEDSPSPEASPNGESSAGISSSSVVTRLAMARSAAQKPVKRGKPASKEKKPPAKKAKIAPVIPSPPQSESPPSLTSEQSPSQKPDLTDELPPKMPDFVMIDSLLIHEDTYLGDKSIPCYCKLPATIPENYQGCGDTCVNRASKYECGSRCPSGQYCSNKKFQKKEYAPVEAFYCGPQKGWGVRATGDIEQGTFLLEYVGELIGELEYYRRRWMYAQDSSHKHHYFMTASRGDVIDATKYGSISRFINHSCNPNCETAKWMIKRRCRIGFFATRNIKKGEEIVFNYQFRSIGEPQKCYCGAPQCLGYIGTQQAPRVEKELSDSESDIDFADLEPTKIVEGMSTPSEEEKPKKKVVKKTKKELNRRRSVRRPQNQPTIEEVTTEELDEFVESGCHLRNAEHVIAAVKLMLRLETTYDRIRFLEAILENNNEASNLWRLFIENEICSVLSYWFHPHAVNESSEYLLKLCTFASWLPLTEQKQVRETGLLEKVGKILEPEESIVQDVIDSLLEEVCADGVRTEPHQARLKTAQLFEKWSNLKVFAKIPKKGRVEGAEIQPERNGDYELKSILRPSYADPANRSSVEVSQQSTSSIPARVSTLRYSMDSQPPWKRPWMHHNQSENNNESPPHTSDEAGSEEEGPAIRSVVGLVSLPTLKLQPPYSHQPRYFHREYNKAPPYHNGEATETVAEKTERATLTPSVVGPRTPVNDPPPQESSPPRMAQVEQPRPTRRSRFDTKKCEDCMPAPALIAPPVLGAIPVSAPASCSGASSPSVSTAPSQEQEVRRAVPEATPFFPTAYQPPRSLPLPPSHHMMYPPPSMMQMMMPPVSLEHARQQVAMIQTHLAYLMAYIDQQEAAKRQPAQNLDARLSEFVQDVEVVDVSPAQEDRPEAPEEVQSTSNRSQSSSQDASFTPKQSHVQVACTSADTTGSSEMRAKFKADIAKFVQSILEPHRKKLFKHPEDFKHLTRKLTHTILEKEEKNNEDLRVTEGVKKKSKEYVLSYIKKYQKHDHMEKSKGSKPH